MVVENEPTAWLVDIVTSLSQATEGVTAVPRSSSPQRIFTVGFCPPVLCSMPVKTAVSREGWVTLIAPKPAGMMVWARAGHQEKSMVLMVRRVAKVENNLIIRVCGLIVLGCLKIFGKDGSEKGEEGWVGLGFRKGW